MKEFNLMSDNELARLLALNREDEITPAQLERLDFLLEQRGQQIEAHLQSLHCHTPRAA